jgi:hypothetical protein
MRTYTLSAPFNIGNNEDILEVVDAWLKETVEQYEHPSSAFHIIETKTIRTQNDTTGKGIRKVEPEHPDYYLNYLENEYERGRNLR